MIQEIVDEKRKMLLEKKLNKIQGISKSKVSHKTNTAQIEHDVELPLSEIQKAIAESGFELVEQIESSSIEKGIKEQNPDYFKIFITFINLMGIFMLIKRFEITRFFPDIDGQTNVLIALSLGLVASFSTCLALVGGIVVSFGSMVQIKEGSKNHFIARALPHIYFHVGRIGGFIFFGGLLGLIGSKINYSPSGMGYFTILIAVVMFYIGLQILGIVPNITKLGFHLPKFLSKRIYDIDAKENHFAPMIIGVLTFFLPCGFTQSMQLAAVASGSFVKGALIMGAFSLGTLPVLFSIGIGSTYAIKERGLTMKNVIGVLIIMFAIFSFNSGFAISGTSVTPDQKNISGDVVVEAPKSEVQVVKMDVNWIFVPAEMKLKKGIPVRWEIMGVNITGCSSSIVIPQLKIRKQINKGLNIIEFTPPEAGVLPFSCWMGMIRGRFNVE